MQTLGFGDVDGFTNTSAVWLREAQWEIEPATSGVFLAVVNSVRWIGAATYVPDPRCTELAAELEF